jgi:hypothetical protein
MSIALLAFARAFYRWYQADAAGSAPKQRLVAAP